MWNLTLSTPLTHLCVVHNLTALACNTLQKTLAFSVKQLREASLTPVVKGQSSSASIGVKPPLTAQLQTANAYLVVYYSRRLAMETAFSTEEALLHILDSSTDSEPDFTGPEELESSSDNAGSIICK